MSDDLVKRLRAGYCSDNDSDEAADRIEALEVDITSWRGIHEGAVLVLQNRISEQRETIKWLDREIDCACIYLERCAKMLAAAEECLKADEQTIRLALGEMTPQDMRNVRAAFDWVIAKMEAKQKEKIE